MELLGLRTTIYPTDDLAASVAFFNDLLGIQPYFDEPFYVGYNVGGYELGINPNSEVADGVQSYWGVTDAVAAAEELIAAGARVASEVSEVGEGIKVAQFRLPDGNLFGIIENPHFALPD
jgi:catechol 2,3-dioxygenase-like lactoylglutathione lyase family enzyme